MPNNKILTSGNAALTVTNLACSPSPGTSTLEGVPIGTANGTATGELAVKVIDIGGGGSGGVFNSTTLAATSNGSIAEGVLSWSITVISGTVTVDGQTIPVGATVGGGGYSGYTLNSAVNYTVTGGTALVNYDTPA